MLRFALVEDEELWSGRLKHFIEQYCADLGEQADFSVYPDAETFLKAYQPGFTVVFMDIAMPGINGMEAAKLLRERDKTVVLVFVTTLAQYAAKGYEVDAMDYIIKPFTYSEFSLRLRRALEHAAANKGHDITIRIPNGLYTTDSNRLEYVEVSGHDLIYHMTDDMLTARGSLTELEKQLAPMGFLRCNACYLVNPRHITRVQNMDVWVGKDILKISKMKKQSFMEALTRWYGEH